MASNRQTASAQIPCVLLLAGICALPACDLSGEDPDPAGYSTVLELLPAVNPNIDILFVIDNTGSTDAEQRQLATLAQTHLFAAIGAQLGAEPNLHIGVISTDMGVGEQAAGAFCSVAGDDGRLLAPPSCGLSGAFLMDVADPNDPTGEQRLRNYSGTLSERFECMAQVGVAGCGFEQPLAAIERALAPGANDGFLRADALLAIVILTTEDDCSATDIGLYDHTVNDPDSELGTFEFRCFEHGVTCAQQDPRAPGERGECRARESAYMASVERYIEAAKASKAHPGMVLAAGIIADDGPVVVEADINSGAPRLSPTCASEHGEAAPAVRLADFLDGFDARHTQARICESDYRLPLGQIAGLIGGTAARGTCLLGDLADGDPASPGIQPECQVVTVAGATTENELHTALSACAAGQDPDSGDTCYRIEADSERCAHSATGLRIRAPHGDLGLRVRCRTPE